jgi:hypothetical protein
MKRYLVVLVIVLVAGAWVAGFVPEYSARHDAEAARDRLQERVDAAESRLRIGELLGQSLALGDLVREERFGEAQPLSSAFFDAIRAESQRVSDPAFRDSLDAVLEARDAITAALSRGEPEASGRIAEVQRRLRRSLGYTVPGGAPPADTPLAAAPGELRPGAAEPSATDGPDSQLAAPPPVPPVTTPTPEPTPLSRPRTLH